jgi:branched-chain amino acid transport system ATP-binding protein
VTEVILQVQDVRKSFGGVQAVRGIDLTLHAGEQRAIIGPNGAGKSTLFNLLSGYYRPDAGRVLFKGQELTGLPPHHICRLGVARSFQHTHVFPQLTVYQNVQSVVLFHHGQGFNVFMPAARLYRQQTEAWLTMVGLLDKSDLVAGTLSAGDRKRLELGIALATEPELLLLDEPTCGMSPVETASTIALVQRIAQERQLTVLFTEHKMDVVFSISGRITVMHFGAVVAEGTPEDIRHNDLVQKIYLGEAEA